MKKILTAVAMALLLLGCAKQEVDVSGIQEKLAELENRVSALEGAVASIQSAIGDGVFVQKVEEYVDPDTGKTVGITVTYTSGKVVYFEISPKAGDSPVLGVISNGAGELVWAVDGVAIKLNGKDVPVYQTPVFTFDEDGYLWVEVDGEKTCLGQVENTGGATLQDGIFTDLAVEQDKVVLTLSDGTKVNIPFAAAFELKIDKTEYVFSKLEAISIPYSVNAKTEKTVVGVAGYNPKDFSVKVEADKIVVTPLSMKAAGVLLAYADSKVGLTSLVNITVEAEGLEVTDEPFNEEVDYMAEGDAGSLVVANVVSNVEFDVKPVDEWIHLVSVKAQAYVITLSLDENATGAIRSGKVNITRKGTDDVIQTITIGQDKVATGTKNLSKNGAANSYIVMAAGDYKFAAVKGNSVESVGAVASADIVWETYNTDEDVAPNSVIAQVGVEEGYITFSTPATLKFGNALIAAKDAAGEILWSWHIWIPETAVTDDAYGDLFGAGVKAMDRNIGALVACQGAAAPESATSYGFLYQWGRKDPFMSAGTNTGDKAKTSVDFEEKSKVPFTVAESIKHPTQFAYNAETAVDPDWDGANWNSENISTLWNEDGKKTIYDPCPPGYKVPVRDSEIPFWASGDWAFDLTNFWYGKSGCVLPYAGFLDDCGGSLSYPGVRNKLWGANESNEKSAYCIYLKKDSYSSSSTHKAVGASVRCVVDDAAPIVPPEPAVVVDLSKDGAANSYIVTAAGDYKLAAVKGNGSESVGAVASADIVWETYNTDEDVAPNSVIAQVGVEDGYITFSTPAALKFGNALIAAKDAAGEILWSWHIWIPETAVTDDAYGDLFGAGVKAMDRNIGALVACQGAAAPESATSYGFLYQWGRKDPFMSAGTNTGDKAKTSVDFEEKSKVPFTVAESIKHPTQFAYNAETAVDPDWDGANWNSENISTLWNEDGKKTIYDPCPPGYKVPVRDSEIPFWASGDWAFDLTNFWYGKSGCVLPYAGFLDDCGGSLSYPGVRNKLWGANESNEKSAYCIYLKKDSYSSSSTHKAVGASVRCVVE